MLLLLSAALDTVLDNLSEHIDSALEASKTSFPVPLNCRTWIHQRDCQSFQFGSYLRTEHRPSRLALSRRSTTR